MTDWTKTKNANGSVDWTTPLPAPRQTSEGTATQVLRWYNFETRDWVVSLADDERHQIGPSTYVAHLADAEAEASALLTAPTYGVAVDEHNAAMDTAFGRSNFPALFARSEETPLDDRLPEHPSHRPATSEPFTFVDAPTLTHEAAIRLLHSLDSLPGHSHADGHADCEAAIARALSR